MPHLSVEAEHQCGVAFDDNGYTVTADRAYGRLESCQALTGAIVDGEQMLARRYSSRMVAIAMTFCLLNVRNPRLLLLCYTEISVRRICPRNQQVGLCTIR